MTFIKPKRLKKGDKVATMSPSWGGPSVYPYIYENGLKYLSEQLKFEIVEYPTARMSADKIYHHPELRAKDINDAFANKDIKAIITSIGGSDSVRILEYLKEEVIVNNPKILLGYSDTATLTTLLNSWGLVTFNGSSIMAGFSQASCFPKSWHEGIRTLLMGDSSNYIYPKFDTFSNGYPDWGNKNNTGLIKESIKSPPYSWLQGKEAIEGVLFGGCIEVLEFLKGTKYWPTKDFWTGKILFFETSEDVPTISNIEYMLRNYGIQGIFDQINGVVFGRARDYTDELNQKLRESVLKIIKGEFGRNDLLVVTDLDFGHTDPQWILPLGIKVQFDPANRKIELLESATQ
ncbi:MAG: S66 peptidase family protein [Patescibacteria group bacterium]|nr:LD-carboxypeptidase [Patescibacteria group bacterium]MBU1953284.1 LD-carboxypeptidase [Patescibacteria group bacterium]